MITVFRTLSLLCFLLYSGPITAQELEYQWPTDASRHLTSTFGETRSAHFHSGLDIKTWGREGYDVFSAYDGYIYRIGVTLKGYGNVLYVKHPDSSITVYAHLQRFRNDIQNYVDSVRIQDYSFETEIYLEPDQFPVSKGEMIGYSGSTGVGPPHLHFEVRTNENNPINALRTNIRVKDDIPPSITSLLAIPRSAQTSIRNSLLPQLYYKSESTEGLTFGTIEADGPVGLAVSAHDGANEVTNKYAVYELGLIHKNDTLFHAVLDEFTFDEADLMFLDRFPAVGASRRSYQPLFAQDGPKVPFYKKNILYLVPEDNLKEYTIFASDYFGNEQRVSVSIKKTQQMDITEAEFDFSTADRLYWSNDWVTNGKETYSLKTNDIGIKWQNNTTRFFSLSNRNELLSRINPDSNYTLITPDQALKVSIKPHTFFDTLSIYTRHSLKNQAPTIEIHPYQQPFREKIELQFYIDEDIPADAHLNLYQYDKSRDRLSYVSSRQTGKTIHAQLEESGEYVVLNDDQAPDIGVPKIRKTDSGRWIVRIGAVDRLSGIDYKNSMIFVNGVRGIVEYDYEQDFLIYYHPDFKPSSTHTIELLVKDNAGNKVSRTFNLRNN